MAEPAESPAGGQQPDGAEQGDEQPGWQIVPFLLESPQPIHIEPGVVFEITQDFQGPPKVTVQPVPIELEGGLEREMVQGSEGPKVVVRRQRKRVPPKRTPNLAVMRERVELCDRLAEELSWLRAWLAKVVARPTPGRLKGRFPKFRLWELLDAQEVGQLAAGVEDFTPRAYAKHLTIRKYGLRSTETLKYYRRMMRQHQAE